MSKALNGKSPAVAAHIVVTRAEAALLMQLIQKSAVGASDAKALGSLYDKVMNAGASLGVVLSPEPQPAQAVQ